MNILSRFTDIVRSNINALLDRGEDPAKLVDQALLDLKRDLAEVRQETAGVIAAEKAAKRDLYECEKNVERYDAAARNALKAGSEADARKLIVKKQRYERQLETLKETYKLSCANSAKIRQMHDKLAADISDLETRRASIKAKVAAAEAQKDVNKVTAGTSKRRSQMDLFERMEDKADQMLDEASAAAELNVEAAAEEDLCSKYGTNPIVSVDDELAQMKTDLGL